MLGIQNTERLLLKLLKANIYRGLTVLGALPNVLCVSCPQILTTMGTKFHYYHHCPRFPDSGNRGPESTLLKAPELRSTEGPCSQAQCPVLHASHHKESFLLVQWGNPFSLKKDFTSFGSSFRYKTKWRGKERFPITACLCTGLAWSISNITHQRGSFITTDEPTRTRHHRPTSVVHFRVHS